MGICIVQELNGLGRFEYFEIWKSAVRNTGHVGMRSHITTIDLAYSDATIESAGWMELELAYSDMEVENSTMIFCESKYSKLIGEKTGGIITEGAYDKYDFQGSG